LRFFAGNFFLENIPQNPEQNVDTLLHVPAFCNQNLGDFSATLPRKLGKIPERDQKLFESAQYQPGARLKKVRIRLAII
jgi:hypothetical protein